MADLDFLLEGLGAGANLALQIDLEDRRRQDEQQFTLDRDRAGRLHEMNVLTAQQGFQESRDIAQRLFATSTATTAFERGAPVREAQIESFRAGTASARAGIQQAPFQTAANLIGRGATPPYGRDIDVPGLPFGLQFQQPTQVPPNQDPEFIRAYRDQLTQSRLIFTELLQQKKVDIDAMARLRASNPEAFEAQIKRFPILGHLPIIGRLFQGSEEAAWNYFLPDETGVSQSDRDIDAANFYENTLLQLGGQSMFPGGVGPMQVPGDTTGGGGPMQITPEMMGAGFGGFGGGAFPGVGQQPVTSDEDLRFQIGQLNVPTKEAENIIETFGEDFGVAFSRLGFTRGKNAPNPSFAILSRAKWSDEVETAIEQRIKDSIIDGNPINREVAIYEIWQTGEQTIGKGKGRQFFQRSQGIFNVKR